MVLWLSVGSMDAGVYDVFFFSSRRRHTRCLSDWSSDVCSSDLEQELSSRQQDLERQRTLLAQAKPQPTGVRTEPDEAKRDVERRVKIIQQKALELLDREEKLRKRAAELEAMEARLSRDVTAE